MPEPIPVSGLPIAEVVYDVVFKQIAPGASGEENSQPYPVITNVVTRR